jgi:hypothetical protein
MVVAEEVVVEKNKLDFGLVTGAVCQGCEEIVPHMFKFLVNTPACLCVDCLREAKEKEELEGLGSEEEKKDDDKRAREALRKRFNRSGLPSSVALALGISVDNTRPDLSGKGDIIDATKEFVGQKRRGILVLSGHNGIGKSVCAGWASWVTRGRFIRRSEWSLLQSFGDSIEEVREIISLPGVVTLDECCAMTSASDSPQSIRTISMIAGERHDSGVGGTIITTRSDKKTFDLSYGNDMLDRMLHFRDSGGSGWVTSMDRVSLRAKNDGHRRHP